MPPFRKSPKGMVLPRWYRVAAILLLLLLACATALWGQAAFDDDRVMLQGPARAPGAIPELW